MIIFENGLQSAFILSKIIFCVKKKLEIGVFLPEESFSLFSLKFQMGTLKTSNLSL